MPPHLSLIIKKARNDVMYTSNNTNCIKINKRHPQFRIAEKKAKLIYLNRMKRGGNVEYFFGIPATIRFSHRMAKRMNSIFSFLLF